MTKLPFKPKIWIKIYHARGYGSLDQWSVSVIYEAENLLLDREVCGSEGDAGRAALLFEQKWKRSFMLDEFKAAIKDKPLASPICDNCKGHTLQGGCSCMDGYWCMRSLCQGKLSAEIKAYREKAQ